MVENIFVESALNKRFQILLTPSLKETFISTLTVGQLLEGRVVKALSDHTFLINFKGLEVVAESAVSLKAGEQIQVRVVQTHPQVVMNPVGEAETAQEMVSTLSISPGPGTTRQLTLMLSPSQREAFFATLTVGQLLEGKVVKALSDHTFLINFKGLEVVAESAVALKAGEQIQVGVVQTHPQMVVSLITEALPEQKVLSLIRSYLPLNLNWGELVESLSRILKGEERSLLEVTVGKEMVEQLVTCLSSLFYDESKVGESNYLRQFIERSGLLYESKLTHTLFQGEGAVQQPFATTARDLKGLLLELSQKLEDGMGRSKEPGEVVSGKVGELLQMVHSSIKRIELHQLVNYLTGKNDQQLVFQIPFALPEGVKTAELYLRYGGQRGKKKKSDHDEFYIIFLLAMRGLGDLRMDTHIVKKSINCTIQVGKKETAHFVKNNLSDLSQRLEALGFKVAKLECSVQRSKHLAQDTPLQGFSLLEIRLLDIMV